MLKRKFKDQQYKGDDETPQILENIKKLVKKEEEQFQEFNSSPYRQTISPCSSSVSINKQYYPQQISQEDIEQNNNQISSFQNIEYTFQSMQISNQQQQENLYTSLELDVQQTQCLDQNETLTEEQKIEIEWKNLENDYFKHNFNIIDIPEGIFREEKPYQTYFVECKQSQKRFCINQYNGQESIVNKIYNYLILGKENLGSLIEKIYIWNEEDIIFMQLEYYEMTILEAMKNEQYQYFDQQNLIKQFNSLVDTCMRLASKGIGNLSIDRSYIGINEQNQFKFLPEAFENPVSSYQKKKQSNFMKENLVKKYIKSLAQVYSEILQNDFNPQFYEPEFKEQIKELTNGEQELQNILIAKFYDLDKEGSITLEYHDILKVQRNNSLKELFQQKQQQKDSIKIENTKEEENIIQNKEYQYFT